MPVLSLACHLPHNTPNIPSRYNNEQTIKQTKAINNSYIYISHVNVTQTVPDISPLMPMHQDPLLVCIVERLVSSVICRFQGLSYSHVPECIEFSFILFIHHNTHFYFESCTYCNILDIYLSWNMNSVKYLFIWHYWIIYFVTCLEVFWSVMS